LLKGDVLNELAYEFAVQVHEQPNVQAGAVFRA
jgi:hypothetical protein